MFQAVLALALSMAHQTNPLTAQSPIVVPGGSGHFDFMNIDPVNRLVFACHPGKSSFAVINLATGEVKDVDAGVAVNGISADSSGKRVFAAGPGKTLVCFETTTWKKVGSLGLDGPGDCVQVDAKRGVVYVDNDDGTSLWIVDPTTMKITGTVAIHEAPEYMEFDETRDRIFQAIKSTSTIQVINPGTKTVIDEWKLGELTSPHGLAIDKVTGRIFVAGKNGKMDIIDAETGKILSVVEVVKGSDQIAYDAGLKRVYIPSQSMIQVIQIDGDNGKVIGTVPVGKDCHRVTVDPSTHDVWVAFADEKDSFVQKFTAQP